MARREALWGSRLVEWSILALVVLVLAGIFGVYAYRVQGQAERAAVISTLGALRTALVVEHLRLAVPGAAPTAAPDHNPFALLERLPINYAGRLSDRQTGELTPGKWVFDADCACVGYKPVHTEQLDMPTAGNMLWFQLETHGSPVPELHAQQAYLWLGQAVN